MSDGSVGVTGVAGSVAAGLGLGVADVVSLMPVLTLATSCAGAASPAALAEGLGDGVAPVTASVLGVGVGVVVTTLPVVDTGTRS